jgi:hypothetical protein
MQKSLFKGFSSTSASNYYLYRFSYLLDEFETHDTPVHSG